MTLEINLIGASGTVYDLRRGPVRLSAEGIKGFGLPEFDAQVIETALADGQRRVGYKLKPRLVALPFMFKGAAANDVDGLQRAFWRDVAIGTYCTLRVTDNQGGTRQLVLHVEDDGGKVYRYDPYDLDPDIITLSFTADQPWWQSDPIEFVYQVNTGAGVNFYGGGDPTQPGLATPFYINSASGSSTTTVDNDGDRPAWSRLTIAQGSSSAFRIGVDGHYIGTAQVLGSGDTLVIETDPLRQTATLNGSLLAFKAFTDLDFAPIPKGTGTKLDIQITGTALVTVRFRKSYQRAF